LSDAEQSDPRLSELLSLVLEVADGHYSARADLSPRGDSIDAIALGLNLMAESLELERDRRRRAEALLRDEVQAYERAPAMFCSVDMTDYSVVKCNQTLATALGTSKESLLGRRFLGFIVPDERPIAEQALHSISTGKVPEVTTFHLLDGDHAPIPVLLSGGPADEAGNRVLLILSDVTRERMLAAQLREAQKLEAVGRLASGVAHDFNNILAVVMGSAALLKRFLPEDHRGMRELAAITNAAENGIGLTRQLLALSKPAPARPSSRVDLNGLLRDSQPLLCRALGPSNRLIFDLDSDLPPVVVEHSELVQVVLNLTVNARDAMPTGGDLTIRSSFSADGAGAPGVVLEVSDTGEGMDESTLARVLEPFFTTKEETGGSGLGLSVCQRIVEQWGGTLELSSEPSAGTRVRITIPTMRRMETPSPVADEVSAATNSSHTVLVVDDDPLVRSVVVSTLEDAGYRVLAASGLVEAQAHAHAEHLDLVVTDVIMPGGGGADVARMVWELQPKVSVIFVSGYSGNQLDDSLLDRSNASFLAKPFDHAELLNKVVAAIPARAERQA
jgi:PAS domain S-box-containing protein